ncbi:MAG: tRNA pseudouridine(55) synthase TruB [Clostridia bacterium]|nr:tRNA pseudouridine(55) synthase TruB [Clostridia bacterium]
MLNGFINLRKSAHISSNKALSILKFILNKNNIATKVGHFGTLDPDAEGVLPVALGRAARLFDYFLDKQKVYYALFRFGIETDTLDASGRVLCTDTKIIDTEDILAAIPSLTGEQEQMPPDYSAKSINGKKAYVLARKGIEFSLKTKKVTVYGIDLLEMTEQNVFALRITCSGGTYIRALARDMAKALGTVGIMQYLMRERSGDFDISHSVSLDELEAAADISSFIMPIDCVLKNMPRYNIIEEEKTRLLNGQILLKEHLPEGYFALYSDGELAGIAIDNQGRLLVKTWLL